MSQVPDRKPQPSEIAVAMGEVLLTVKDEQLPESWPHEVLRLLNRNGVTTWPQLQALRRETFLVWQGAGRTRLRQLAELIRASGQTVVGKWDDVSRQVPLSEMLVAPVRFVSPDPEPAYQPLPGPPPRPRRILPSGVYFVQSAPFIKIGLATDVIERFSGLMNGNPHELVPLGWIRTEVTRMADLEAALHRQFATHRHRGEWFRVHQDLLDFIRDHAQPWPTKR